MNIPANEKYKYKVNKLKENQKNEYNSLRFQKVLSATAQKIIDKDSKILSFKDWEEIGLKAYRTTNKIQTVRIRRTMSQEIVKDKLNSEIVQLLLKHNITKDKPFELLAKAEKIALKKEETSNIIRLSERYSKMLGLEDNKPGITAKRTVSYIKMLEDGAKETVKVTEKI